MMSPYMKYIYEEINKLSVDDTRIYYFKSGQRDIIEHAVESKSIRKLGIKNERIASMEEGIFFEQVYKDMGGFATINIIPKTTSNAKKEPDFEKYKKASFFMIKDFHIHKKENQAQYIKAFLDADWAKDKYLLISSNQVCIPEGFSDDISLINCRKWDVNDIAWLLENCAEESSNEYTKQHYTVTTALCKEKAKYFVGLSYKIIKRLLNKHLPLAKYLSKEEEWNVLLKSIRDVRKSEADKDDTIEYTEIQMKEPYVSGYKPFTDYIGKIADDFCQNGDEKWGIKRPKGVIVAGIPGTGKTDLAKETARILSIKGKERIPLVKFHIDKLKGENYGNTEANMNYYLDKIGSYEPCVLLIDEIEKTFDKNQMHIVTRSVMTLLLWWLQEHKERIYVFFTANSIEQLDDALLRDGRLDMRYFAFMPTSEDLSEILRKNLLTTKNMWDVKDKEFIEILDVKDKEFIENLNKNKNDKLIALFDKVIQNEQKNQKRHLFMTGANLVNLVNLTRMRLRDKKAVYGKITYDNFKEAFLECASESSFTPHGVTALKEIATTWILLHERQYTDISEPFMDPFDSNERKFKKKDSNKEETQSYNGYMKKILQEEIEKHYKITKKENENE